MRRPFWNHAVLANDSQPPARIASKQSRKRRSTEIGHAVTFDYPRRKGSRVRSSRVSGVATRRTALLRSYFFLKLREKVAHSGAACASQLFSAVFAVTLLPSDI